MVVSWSSVKEHRGSYLVEYCPAFSGHFLASLTITYVLEGVSTSGVVIDMERELEFWLKRFAIPLMVGAFDYKGDAIELVPDKEERYLAGYIENDVIQSKWGVLEDEFFPDIQKNDDYQIEVYKGLDCVTQHDVEAKSEERLKMLKAGWVIVFLWAVAIPALIAVLGFFNILFVGGIALIYSLYKAVCKSLEMFGVVGTSKTNKEKEEEERLMKHHHYHCKRNPEAFMRMKIENLKVDEIERIKNESKRLVDGCSELTIDEN